MSDMLKPCAPSEAVLWVKRKSRRAGKSHWLKDARSVVAPACRHGRFGRSPPRQHVDIASS
eukprot:scaffold803_cov310-Pinguiococcus_pyrenoidosus.AAC.172